MRNIFILFILVMLITSCTEVQEKNKIKEESRAISENELVMATLYNYYAEEYFALAYQAFNVARGRVDEIRSENPANENLAIVVDIDETLLDNSPYQALMIELDTNYPYMWNEWCKLAKARSVPGAVEFLQYADASGFKIYYVSNRKEKYVQESSIKNLDSLGFPQLETEHFLLRLERSDDNPDPSDKQKRRDMITARGNEIVLLVGDNLGDFYTDEKDKTARSEQVEEYKENFGRKFIVIPNAMYGNWPGSTGIKDHESMDSLIRVMSEVLKTK